MLIKIRHGLLEVVNYPNNKISAIILNDELIITSGIVLEPYINLKNNSTVAQKLLNSELIKIQSIIENNDNDSDKDKDLISLKSLKFEITFDEKRFNESSSRVLTRYRANFLYLFNVAEIQNSLRSILTKFQSIDITNSSISKENSEILYSSFVILNLIKPDKGQNFDGNLKKIIAYSKIISQINKLDDVMTICTPFGLENFYKTVNFGKVANILGQKDCLFVISNNLSIGCEGSAVFNNKLRLIGILICTTWQKNNEIYNLTVAGNFKHIIRDFGHQYGLEVGHNWVERQPVNPTWEKSLIIILANGSQGTGTFVKIGNKKFILTCSHVINKHDSDSITCRYINGTFLSNIIWQNPNIYEPFDVALLSVPKEISSEYCVRLSSNRPHLGQNIFNAGFPFFTNFKNANEIDFTPAIYDGRIIKCNTGVIISDGRLQAGQSGGPMFDENGTVLGICVSNLKLENTIYPNINTSIPIFQIKGILEEFAKSNDIKALNNLVASKDVKRIWALEAPLVESKL